VKLLAQAEPVTRFTKLNLGLFAAQLYSTILALILTTTPYSSARARACSNSSSSAKAVEGGAFP